VARRGEAWRGVAWRGEARRGVAWRGAEWRGVAWRGVASTDIQTGTQITVAEPHRQVALQKHRVGAAQDAGGPQGPASTGRVPQCPHYHDITRMIMMFRAMMTRIRQLETDTQADRHTDSDRHCRVMCLPIIEGQSKNLNHFVATFSRIKRKSETSIWSNGWPENSVTEFYNFQTAHRITAGQVEAAAQPTFCFYEATIIILHTA
jgi:hypothetical protein